MPRSAGAEERRTYIGADACEELVEFLNRHGVTRVVSVADKNTDVAVGDHLYHRLAESGLTITRVVLPGEEVIADEWYLAKLLVSAPTENCVFVSVGAGTITDITRLVSHRMKMPFVSYPTAASVDGFTSIGAPVVLDGVKITLIAQPPVAIFADLNVLSNAPIELTAAGFGDMLGKLTAIADWRLGNLVWSEPYEETIARRTLSAVDVCTENASEIARRSQLGLQRLIEALIESGDCMLDFGTSRPASGSEHHISHYWEMKLLQESRPAILHGAKVAVATAMIAQLYDRIRELTVAEVEKRLNNTWLPERESERRTIRAAYGTTADSVIAEHTPFLEMTAEHYDRIKQCIITQWDRILAIADEVPRADFIRRQLYEVKAPSTPEELGLSADEVRAGRLYAHYLRNRFTVVKLARMLGLHSE